MPGIDKSRVVDKTEEELDEFTCDICHDILEVPVVAQCCGKTFCKVCIDQWLEVSKTCPNDRKKLIPSQLRPAPLMVKNLLNKLKIRCEWYGIHCQSELTIEEMAKHLKKCNFCNSCKSSQKLLSDNKNEIEKLKRDNEKLEKVLDQTINELLGKLYEFQTIENQFESEIGRLRKDLGQSKDELSFNQMEIETLQLINEKLQTDLDQSNNELEKLKTFISKPKQTEEEAIINARNISTPIKQSGFKRFSEEDVTYLTNLAKSALSQKSFFNISKFIHDQIGLNPNFKQMNWVIITALKDHFSCFTIWDKLLKLTFNAITIGIIGFKAGPSKIEDEKNDDIKHYCQTKWINILKKTLLIRNLKKCGNGCVGTAHKRKSEQNMENAKKRKY